VIRATVTPEMAARLEKVLGSTADDWLRMQMSHDLPQLRAKGSSLKVNWLVPAFLRRFESPALNKKTTHTPE